MSDIHKNAAALEDAATTRPTADDLPTSYGLSMAAYSKLRFLLNAIDPSIPFGGKRQAEILDLLATAKPVSPPEVIVYTEGGVISWVAADRPCDVMLVDYDVEDNAQEDISQVDQFDGKTVEGVVRCFGAEVETSLVASRFHKFVSTAGKAC